jgi:oxygen-dependent protoporphyrinogen oxidase
MAGGIGVIPEAMARITPVTLISTVSSIRVRGDQLTIVTDRAEVDADFVVLATTAWVAARLNSGGSETEQALMATQYHATILLAIATSPGYRLPSALSDVYGVLFGRANPGRIAAIAFERNQSPDRVPAGKLLNVMLDSEAAREAMSWSDDATLAWVMPELEGRFPGISGQIAWAQVTRWPEAIPQSPVGRSGAIYRYRNQDHRQRRVFLAGDYLGFPWTDSAAATGIWAAEQIVAQHRSRAE